MPGGSPPSTGRGLSPRRHRPLPIPPSSHLDETRDRAPRVLQGAPELPRSSTRISTLPEHADDCRPPPSGSPSDMRRIGVENVEVEETGRPSDRLRRLAPRRPVPRPSSSIATTTSSRSTRSTCGTRRRSSRSSVDGRMVRPAARPTTRARSTCTCGRSRRSSRRAAASGQPQVRLRGRGGERLASTSTPGSRSHRDRLARRRRDHQRHGLLRGQPAGDHDRPARHDVRPDRRDRRAVDLHSGGTAARSRTRRTRWPGSSPRSRAPTAGSASRASTTTSRAHRPRPRGARRAAVRRGGVPRARSACPRWSASPGFTALERQGRPADPRRQRHLGRLRGRGRQDDHPGPRPREGQLPAGADQDPRGSSTAARVRRGDRAARRDRDVDVTSTAGPARA